MDLGDLNLDDGEAGEADGKCVHAQSLFSKLCIPEAN